MMIIALVVIILVLVLPNVRIVPQQAVYVIERLGKYQASWEAGIHVKIPVLDRIVKKISLKEQVLDFPPQPVITKDNVTMRIDSVVFAKVFDPKLYTYGVEDPIFGLQNLSATTLRNIIGDMELDQTLTSRDEINGRLQTILDEATDAWGLKVTRVELKNITPPKEIEDVMTTQMRAERERRQTVLEAQAHQESVVSRAEGDKKAKILAAEAEKEARIAEASGQVARFNAMYDQYRLNPLITKKRIFYEAMEDVLPELKVIISDGSTQTMMPLESFADISVEAADGGDENGK